MSAEPEVIEVRDSIANGVPGDGVRAHWLRPEREGPRNDTGLILLPIQGGDYEVSTLFAKAFAKKGFHTLRFERRAEWLDPSVPIDVLPSLVGAFVANVSEAVDLWLQRPGAPTNPKLGLFGVSMGAITGTLVAARDPRISASVLCIGGGGLADILEDGRDDELNAWRDDVTAKLGGPAAFRAAIREHVDQVDVLGAAADVRSDTTRFIAARFDRVVPWSASVALWNALGKPRRAVLPTGHYSAVVGVPWIKWASTRWFDTHLVNGAA